MQLTSRSLIASIALAVLSFTLTPMTMSADVLYDNLSSSSGAISGGTAGVAPAPTAHGPLGDSFSTGSAPVELTDLKLLLEAATPSDGKSFTVSLYSSGGNTPGSLLSTIATDPDSVLNTTLSTVDFTLNTPIALAANTQYWIEVTSANGGSADWSFDTTNVGTGVASQYNYYNGASEANSLFTPYQMEVTASPEPATWALFAAGLALLPAVRRKFRI